MKYHIAFDIDFKRNDTDGLYISLEGVDGSGKTTQLEHLKKHFEDQGREVVITREPRKNVGLIGDLIQDILRGKTNISPIAFQYLFSADRQMHHQELILPALKAGKVVISDRCFWSAIPYGLLDKEESVENNSIYQKMAAQSILSFYHGFTVPDHTFYLKTSVPTALRRVQTADGRITEIYEDKQKLRRAIQGYEWLLNEFPDEFIVVDGNKTVDYVTKAIIRKLKTIPAKRT